MGVGVAVAAGILGAIGVLGSAGAGTGVVTGKGVFAGAGLGVGLFVSADDCETDGAGISGARAEVGEFAVFCWEDVIVST